MLVSLRGVNKTIVMSVDVKQLLDEIKQSTYFYVVMDMAEPIQFKGKVPFDIWIENNTATFKVLAQSYDEAEHKVMNYLWNDR